HALFGSLSLRGIGLLLKDLIVVDISSFVILLFVVKFCDVERIFGLTSLKNLEVILRLRNFFAVRITQQKIFECLLSPHSSRLIIAGCSARLKINVANLIHRVRSDIAVWIAVYDLLKSCDRRGNGATLLEGLADAVLG